MIFGYSRVSTTEQDLQAQIEKLKSNGADYVFEEKYSGKSLDDRVVLKSLLNDMNEADILLITKIDRLARSIVDLRAIILDCLNKGITVKFIDNNLVFKPNQDDPMATFTLNMLGAFAEFERDLIITRTQEGKAWAKHNKKDYKEGRPKRTLNNHYLHAIELMRYLPMKEVQKKTNISISTLYRIKRQYLSEVQQGIRENTYEI